MRRLLLTLIVLALAWAAIVTATGGVQWKVGGVLLRSRDPGRALLVALLAIAADVVWFRAEFLRDFDRARLFVRRFAPLLAIVCAILLFANAVRFGSFTAAGADSYGYVSQAYGWARGQLPTPIPTPLRLPWPSSDQSQAPLGYTAGPQPGTIVPTYSPGLPLLMAIALIAGPCGPYFVVPICAAALVWLTFLFGRIAGGPSTGVVAAVFMTMSPIVVYMAMWPMSDLPVAVFWTAAAVAALRSTRGGALTCGIFTGVALLVRPNLFAPPLVMLVQVASAARGRERLWRMALFGAAAAPAVLFVAWLNNTWYGAPWRSGYGATSDLYSLSSIVPNLQRYPLWLWESHTPLVLLALLPLVPRLARTADRPAIRLSYAMFVAVLLCYLPYFPFEQWWYLRFLLPAMPALAVLIAVAFAALARMPTAGIRAFATLAAIWLVWSFSSVTIREGTLGPLKYAQRRYSDVGEYVRTTLPKEAAFLTMEHSGTIRFYGGRLTLRHDLMEKEWVQKAPAEMQRRGYKPYLVAEDWEYPQVRMQFGIAPGAPLPWPVIGRMRDRGGVTIFDLSGPAAPIMPVALDNLQSRRCAPSSWP